MERMWSPWRSQHLESTTDPAPGARAAGTVFSRMAAEDRDADNLIVWRGTRVFVVMNLYPYNNGHVLIVPFREVADYEALTDEEQAELARTVGRCMRWLRAALAPDGFNVGLNQGLAGGAGIPEHLHVHVVPRWRGDTNFMPTTADLKVIPEALADTYRKLRRAADADAAGDP